MVNSSSNGLDVRSGLNSSQCQFCAIVMRAHCPAHQCWVAELLKGKLVPKLLRSRRMEKTRARRHPHLLRLLLLQPIISFSRLLDKVPQVRILIPIRQGCGLI